MNEWERVEVRENLQVADTVPLKENHVMGPNMVVRCEECRAYSDIPQNAIGCGKAGTVIIGKSIILRNACPACRGTCIAPGGEFRFVDGALQRVTSNIRFLEAVEFGEVVAAMRQGGSADAMIRRLVCGFAPDYEARIDEIKRENIALKAVITPCDGNMEGQVVRAAAIPWFEIIACLEKDPNFACQIHWRKWEEIIAAAYDRAGFDEVILTPRSNDGGRDIIATKKGIVSVRFFDQVKAYRPGHLVTAEEVRSLVGVLTMEGNVSKGVLTTTSDFAPGVMKDTNICRLIPNRLELKPFRELLPWLLALARDKNMGRWRLQEDR
jgi:restriction system protein